jgi:hypothetical protein
MTWKTGILAVTEKRHLACYRGRTSTADRLDAYLTGQRGWLSS